MATVKTVQDVNLSGKRVLVRCDFNVPFDAEGKISDDTRIVGALPTIKHLAAQGAKVILCSHLGRPKGEKKPEFTLAPVAVELANQLGQPVTFVEDCIGESVKAAVDAMEDGQVILLENVRYYPGEEKNDPEFAKQLAAVAEAYVNDAFGTAHRATPPPKASRTSSTPLLQASSSRRSWNTSAARRRRPSAPSSSSSAARKFPIRSPSSTRSWKNATPC